MLNCTERTVEIEEMLLLLLLPPVLGGGLDRDPLLLGDPLLEIACGRVQANFGRLENNIVCGDRTGITQGYPLYAQFKNLSSITLHYNLVWSTFALLDI